MVNFNEFIDRRGSDCKKYSPNDFATDVLPMWIADTDFKIPKAVTEAILKRTEHEVYGYPYELPEFEQVVVDWMSRRYNWEIKTDDVEFSPGVIAAEVYALKALTRPGEQVVTHTPLYPPLQEAVANNGRKLVSSPLINNNGYYTIDFELLEEQLANPRTVMYVLCNPHNPVGRNFTREELKKIGNLCLKYNVIVFADEIHADVTYGDHNHIPFASLSDEIANITITGMNPGKAFNVAGLRTAAAIIQNPKIRERFVLSRNDHKGVGRTIFGQIGFIACYEDGDEYVDDLNLQIKENVNYLHDFIEERLPEITFCKPEELI